MTYVFDRLPTRKALRTSEQLGSYRDVVVDKARLALMLARDELHQLVTAYCRAVDRADYEALRSLYHPAATDSHGAFSTGGVEQFIAQLQAAE
ncbi:MAG: nuclear transport factor 2 family protein, partial [Mycobacterium sp.]